MSARASTGPSATSDVRNVQTAAAVTPFQVGLDSSSPDAFIRSVAPYAARVSKATGIPAEALIGMAANETGFGKYASHNNLFGIKGTGPAGTFSTPTWEDYGNGPVTIVDNFRAYHSPAESFMDFADLVTTSPRYRGAVGQTSVEGFVSGLKAGGYMTDPDYVQKISGITTRYSSVIKQSLAASSADGAPMARPAPPAANVGSSVARPSSGVVVPNQFAIGLPTDEALAACGPVAAIAFAQVYGRNPTPTEAMDLAKQSGWTAEGGMNGIYNEKRLLDKLNLPNQLEVGQNWDHIRAEAVQHQPVVLATPGHYFVIDGYDPNTGAYHVGQSGKVYRSGSDWMTPAQISAVAGAPSGALFTVHPLANQSRDVLPPLELGNTPGPPPIPAPPPPAPREVLPPLDLGNTPPPPPIPAPAPPPAEPEPVRFIPVRDMPPPELQRPAVSAPPPSPVAQPIHDVPPPPLASALAPAPAPAPAAEYARTPVPHEDPPTLIQAATPPPADTAQASPVHPGLAVGAIAAGSQQPKPPEPKPVRRRPEDELDSDA